MPLNPYETLLNLPKPKCCSNGACCKGVSPSLPARDLLKLAAEGDDFARGFFSIMQPYNSHTEAAKEAPGIVEKTLAAAKTSPHFKGDLDLVVFYRCRYLQPNNRCGVHNDRPQFCRDYPDTPFIVIDPNCAYLPWAKACKVAYHNIKNESEHAQAELEKLPSHLATGVGANEQIPHSTNVDHLFEDNWRLVLSLTPLYVASPLTSLSLGNDPL